MLDFELTEEQAALQDTARKFTRDKITPIAAECDKESRFPKDVYREACQLGFVAASIPEAYGGSGLDAVSHALL